MCHCRLYNSEIKSHENIRLFMTIADSEEENIKVAVVANILSCEYVANIGCNLLKEKK